MVWKEECKFHIWELFSLRWLGSPVGGIWHHLKCRWEVLERGQDWNGFGIVSKVLAAETMDKTSKGKIIELGQTHAGNKGWGMQSHGLCIQRRGELARGTRNGNPLNSGGFLNAPPAPLKRSPKACLYLPKHNPLWETSNHPIQKVTLQPSSWASIQLGHFLSL